MKLIKTNKHLIKKIVLPTIELKHACPLCKGSVKGNNKIKYYCKNCNMLFDERNLTNENK